MCLDNLFVFFQFCFEGMEESGSEGLDELLEKRKNDFMKVMNNIWLKQYICVLYQ